MLKWLLKWFRKPKPIEFVDGYNPYRIGLPGPPPINPASRAQLDAITLQFDRADEFNREQAVKSTRSFKTFAEVRAPGLAAYCGYPWK